MLRLAGAKSGEVFYDLGCGSGKPVVAAALSGTALARCVGVEILPSLAECGKRACEQVRTRMHDAAAMRQLQLSPVDIHVEKGDFLDAACSTWLREADMVYFSSICFSDAMTQQCFSRARGMRPGSRVLTLKLPETYEPYFTVADKEWVKMSWGRILVYLLVRSEVCS